MNRMHQFLIKLAAPLALLTVFTLGGCASSPPQASFSTTPTPQTQIDANDTVTVTLEANSDVIIERHERVRLTDRILRQINTQKSEAVSGGEEKSYAVDVVLSQYERGNAFARFMLAGLGQIHIDGSVTVYELPARTKVSAFEIEKTFAWGGFYGGSTGIDDVEPAFAEGIANAVTSPKDVARNDSDD